MRIPAVLPDNWESVLDERERTVIDQCVIGIMSMAEFARQHNCSRQRINAIRNRAFRKLVAAIKWQKFNERYFKARKES